jgi:hydrophobic/amphiphilic exporter-1 (mainly G- bacteria), HAE1 family
MNIAALYIRRPISTSLVTMAFVLFGIMAYRELPVSDLPNVDFPTLLVSASLPGASPETMASAVATPLERQFSTIAGIASMNSTNALGSTQIVLQFQLDRNIDAASQDVQSAISRAAPLLPPGMPNPPTTRKVNPADQPVVYIGVTSSTLPLYTVDEYAETLLAQQISMVSGVAQVQVYGAQKYAVRVELDPRALANRGIGIDEVASSLQAANVNIPTGALYGPTQAFTVQASGQLTEAALYRPIIIAYRGGSPVRLEDLGQVVDSVEDDKTASWYGSRDTWQRSVVLAVQRQPGTNTVEVVRAVRDLLPRLEKQIPPSVELHVLFDRSESIIDSVNDVKLTMLLAFILVVLVIFLFLRNVSATVIPSLALPVSVIGTFAFMYLLDYSLDNLSLMALTLSIAFVVDDAIVVLENITRHLEMGVSRREAALEGSREIGFTILSMTLSLTAVFIPVLFMPGIVGRLFHEFGVTISVAILISGFVSLSLTPMLCSRFLSPSAEGKHGRLYAVSERAFERALALYEQSLRWVLERRRAALVASFVVLAATAWLFVLIPKGFLPDPDQGAIFCVIEGPQGISFRDMAAHEKAIADLLRGHPAVRELFATVVSAASGNGSTSNQGRMFLHLVPRADRPPVGALINEFRATVAAVPGVRVFLQQLPAIRLSGQLTKSLYQLTLQSGDTAELYRYAQDLEGRMSNLAELRDVTSDLQLSNPQVDVEIDRDRASALAVTAEQIEDTLYSAYGNRWVSTIYAPDNQYKVILELGERFQTDPGLLSLLYVRSTKGALVPLGAVASFRPSIGPLTINHSGQLPAVTISFDLAPGVALGQAVDRVEGLVARTVPATVTTSFQGTAQAFASSLSGLWALLAVAVLVIYLVLGILYESYVHPITILSGLPSAGFGALLTLLLLRVDLNIYAIVGLILLIGIVKKNAIMQIDFALEAQRREHKSPLEAIYQGCVIRFRPIMMTTMAALFGTLPIALGVGAGAAVRRPLGLAVVGGLLFSQLVTLYLTPVYYTFLEALVARVRNRWGRRPPSDAGEPLGHQELPQAAASGRRKR